MKRAVEEIKKLLVPSVEGDDELKKKQLMELALLNGTYKGYNNVFMPGGNPFAPPGAMLALPVMVRSPEHAGAPIFLPPPMSLPGGHHFFAAGPLSPITSPAAFNGTLHHPPPPALMSPPGGEQAPPPPGFFYQLEPCLLSPASPMMEYTVSPLDYGRHQQLQQHQQHQQQQLMQHQQHSVPYAR
jgi:hypothetical protein